MFRRENRSDGGEQSSGESAALPHHTGTFSVAALRHLTPSLVSGKICEVKPLICADKTCTGLFFVARCAAKLVLSSKTSISFSAVTAAVIRVCHGAGGGGTLSVSHRAIASFYQTLKVKDRGGLDCPMTTSTDIVNLSHSSLKTSNVCL